MALNSGYQHFEGLAFFGYHIEGEGHEVIVVLGERVLQIQTFDGDVLSIWAPGAYDNNGKEIPERTYFSGNEWLAPQDADLAKVLDRYMAENNLVLETAEIIPQPQKSYAAFRTVGVTALALASLALLVVLVLQSSLTRITGPNIAARMDADIISTQFASTEVCDDTGVELMRNYILELSKGTDFRVVNNLGAPIARLPSGTLLIDASIAATMQNQDDLVALLQLVHQRNQTSNPAHKMVSELSLLDKINFLRTGELPVDNLAAIWQTALNHHVVSATDYNKIEKPKGNFINAYSIAGVEVTDAKNVPTDLDFEPDAWQRLITICPIED